jgi:hypothetical protein
MIVSDKLEFVVPGNRSWQKPACKQGLISYVTSPP